MYVFDQNYMEETLKFPKTGEFSFTSVSNRVIIGVCHKFVGTGKEFIISYRGGGKSSSFNTGVELRVHHLIQG